MNESEEVPEVETQIVKVEDAPPPVVQMGGSIFDMPTEVFSAALERRKANRSALIEWLWKALVKGTDYGSIHVVSRDKCPAQQDCKNERHWSKPCLFKPGAEKICGMLGVTAKFPAMEQYEARALSGEKIETIVLKCELISSSGSVIAQGLGARLVTKDYGDINKSFKMAQKSGQIDATLRMAGLSEIFTQDLEDAHAAESVPAEESSASGVPRTCPLKGCGSPIAEFESESKQALGRRYFMCSFGYQEKQRLVATGRTNAQANGAVSKHYREWAEPWPRQSDSGTTPKPAGVTESPVPTEPSIMDKIQAESARIAAEIAAEQAQA